MVLVLRSNTHSELAGHLVLSELTNDHRIGTISLRYVNGQIDFPF
jgi:hypothetical protein